jgi:hypothetical protein
LDQTEQLKPREAFLGASSVFNGTILAAVSASLGDAVSVQGRVLTDSGAVTLINDSINTPACSPDEVTSR